MTCIATVLTLSTTLTTLRQVEQKSKRIKHQKRPRKRRKTSTIVLERGKIGLRAFSQNGAIVPEITKFRRQCEKKLNTELSLVNRRPGVIGLIAKKFACKLLPRSESATLRRDPDVYRWSLMLKEAGNRCRTQRPMKSLFFCLSLSHSLSPSGFLSIRSVTNLIYRYLGE